MTDFPIRLDSLMQRAGIKNPAHLALVLGVSDRTARNYLEGRNLPDSPTLLKIAKYFAGKTDDVGELMIWLLTGEDSKTENTITSGILAPVSNDETSDKARESIRQMLFDIDKLQDPQKTKKIAQVVKILSALPEKKVDTALKMVKLIKKEKIDS